MRKSEKLLSQKYYVFLYSHVQCKNGENLSILLDGYIQSPPVHKQWHRPVHYDDAPMLCQGS